MSYWSTHSNTLVKSNGPHLWPPCIGAMRQTQGAHRQHPMCTEATSPMQLLWNYVSPSKLTSTMVTHSLLSHTQTMSQTLLLSPQRLVSQTYFTETKNNPSHSQERWALNWEQSRANHNVRVGKLFVKRKSHMTVIQENTHADTQMCTTLMHNAERKSLIGSSASGRGHMLFVLFLLWIFQ